MRRVADDLKAQWRSIKEVEGDLPGYDYSRGYAAGWYERRHSGSDRSRIRPDGSFRLKERVREFRMGYNDGWIDGKGKDIDWWPDFAKGRLEAGQVVVGSGTPVLERLMEHRRARDAAAAEVSDA